MAGVTQLQINGKTWHVEVDAETSLLSVLRDHLDLTGAKYGCGEGQCGACTVLIDGLPAVVHYASWCGEKQTHYDH
jgi:aerobic-type carbon monoxide dehydrogenase small subunit (CoxS/CutS family)